MPITLGDTSITGLGVGGLPAGTVNATTLAAGAARTNFGAGAVLQVVGTVKTDTSSTSGTSFVTLPGLSASITPSSASNKVLVCWTIWFGQTLQHNRAVGTLQRNIGGSIAYPFIGNADGSRERVTWGTQDSGAIHGATYCATGMYLDSPSTTSAATYNFLFSGEGGTVYINRGNEADGNSSVTQRLASSLIVMEIAG